VRALVAGAAGQLGRELRAHLGEELLWAGGRGELDVTDEAAVAALVARLRPDVVFNATAYNRVDAAESEPERAFAVNALAPRALAKAARDAGALLVHVSSDYVFDGASARPYLEDDAARPLSVYGASKLLGEQHVLASGAEALVVRTSGVLGQGGSAQKGGRSSTASSRRRARESRCGGRRPGLRADLRGRAGGCAHRPGAAARALSRHEPRLVLVARPPRPRSPRPASTGCREPITAAELKPARRPSYSSSTRRATATRPGAAASSSGDALAELVA
jgi:hypothetical protein